MNDPEDDDQFDPLEDAGARLPPILGAGCAARFDPEALDEERGTDFACAAQWMKDSQGG